MNKLYEEYFYVPEEGKVREKVMLARVAATFVVMILCLIVMSITAFAYFAQEVSAQDNIIIAAKYKLDIKVTENGAPVNVINSRFVAESGKKYDITLNYKKEGSAQTGFGVVKIGELVYHTEQIGADKDAQNGRRDTFEFSLTVSGNSSVNVDLISHWGTSSRYEQYNKAKSNGDFYIINKETIGVNVNAVETEESYTVKSGDTLSYIASRYGVTTKAIAEYNKLENENFLQIGQVLKISVVKKTVTVADPSQFVPSEGDSGTGDSSNTTPPTQPNTPPDNQNGNGDSNAGENTSGGGNGGSGATEDNNTSGGTLPPASEQQEDVTV